MWFKTKNEGTGGTEVTGTKTLVELYPVGLKNYWSWDSQKYEKKGGTGIQGAETELMEELNYVYWQRQKHDHGSEWFRQSWRQKSIEKVKELRNQGIGSIIYTGTEISKN